MLMHSQHIVSQTAALTQQHPPTAMPSPPHHRWLPAVALSLLALTATTTTTVTAHDDDAPHATNILKVHRQQSLTAASAPATENCVVSSDGINTACSNVGVQQQPTTNWLTQSSFVAVGGQSFNPFSSDGAIRLTNSDSVNNVHIGSIELSLPTPYGPTITCNYGQIWNITGRYRKTIEPTKNIVLTYDQKTSDVVLPCSVSSPVQHQHDHSHNHNATASDGAAILHIIYYTSNRGGHTMDTQMNVGIAHVDTTAHTYTGHNLLDGWQPVPVVSYSYPKLSTASDYKVVPKDALLASEVTQQQPQKLPVGLGGYAAVQNKIAQTIDDSGLLPTHTYPTPPDEFTFGQLYDPRIELRKIENFLSDDECDQLIKYADDKYVESMVVEATNTKATHTGRTSTTAYIYKNSSPLADAIELKAAQLLNGNTSHIEGLQVVRYLPGQQFTAHYDWFQTDYVHKIRNQRQYTLFAYLNDVDEGGETSFPKVNQTFRPQRGAALFWRNAKDINTPYVDSLHSGDPPRGDTIKYGLNIWYNFNDLSLAPTL